MTRGDTGRLGEALCARYLERHGYTIAACNFHARCGEVDVIAETESEICFVEVKTRRENAMVSPAQAVDLQKQQKLVLTAQVYLQQHPSEKQPRFDVFEVLTDAKGKPTRQRHLLHAFDASCIDGLYY